MKNYIWFLIFSFSCSYAKILITGGFGFIGSHLCEKLLENGGDVVLLDKSLDSHKDARGKLHKFESNLKIYVLDLLDKEELNEVFKQEKPDVICHCAGISGISKSFCCPELYIKNIIMMLNVLEMAKKYRVGHIIFTSSSSVYGDVRIPVNEKEKCAAQSTYAFSKYACELLGELYFRLYGIPCTCLRLFNVYGPRSYSSAPFIFMDVLYHHKPITITGDGNAKRDYIFIDDVINFIIDIVNKPAGYNIINIGTGLAITTLDLVKTLESIMNCNADIIFKENTNIEVLFSCADVSLMKSVHNEQKVTLLENGLSKMYDWYVKEYIALKK